MDSSQDKVGFKKLEKMINIEKKIAIYGVKNQKLDGWFSE